MVHMETGRVFFIHCWLGHMEKQEMEMEMETEMEMEMKTETETCTVVF